MCWRDLVFPSLPPFFHFLVIWSRERGGAGDNWTIQVGKIRKKDVYRIEDLYRICFSRSLLHFHSCWRRRGRGRKEER